MELPQPLIKGRLVRRYQRFLCDVILEDGESVTAHCPNPGSMMGLKDPDLTVWLSTSDNPKRKLRHTLEVVEADGTSVGIHTGRPNDLAEEAIRDGLIAGLSGYASLRREVRYGENSRIDLLLEDGADPRPCYVEVKNVHLRREAGLAEFPDSVTSRGAKHLAELARMVEADARGVMLFIIQRDDCDTLRLAADLDPAYAEAFADARGRGVEAFAAACSVSTKRIRAHRLIPIEEPAAGAPRKARTRRAN